LYASGYTGYANSPAPNSWRNAMDHTPVSLFATTNVVSSLSGSVPGNDGFTYKLTSYNLTRLDLTNALSLPVNHSLQTTCLYPSLSCAASIIIFHLYLKSASSFLSLLHISLLCISGSPSSFAVSYSLEAYNSHNKIPKF